jgi:hypothetical protein
MMTHPTCCHHPLCKVALQGNKNDDGALSSSLWSCAIATKNKSTTPFYKVAPPKKTLITPDGGNT